MFEGRRFLRQKVFDKDISTRWQAIFVWILDYIKVSQLEKQQTCSNKISNDFFSYTYYTTQRLKPFNKAYIGCQEIT